MFVQKQDNFIFIKNPAKIIFYVSKLRVPIFVQERDRSNWGIRLRTVLIKPSKVDKDLFNNTIAND